MDLVVVFTVSRFAYGSLSDSFSGFAFGKLIPCFNLYVIGAYLKLWHDQPHITRGGVSEQYKLQQVSIPSA